MSPAEILTILPNLSIGVVAVMGMVYIAREFTRTIDRQAERTQDTVRMNAERHEAAMLEREHALREVEKDVRNNILGQLNQNTEAMKDTSKTLERVMQLIITSKQ